MVVVRVTMSSTGSTNSNNESTKYVDLTARLDQLRLSVAAAFEDLKKNFPNIDTANDARFTMLSRSYVALTNTELGLAFIRFHLINREWWNMVDTRAMSDADIQEQINGFSTFLKIGLIQFLFASIENSFRIFVRALYPGSCNNGTAEFKNIYAFLLTKLGLTHYFPLLDLVRNIRNTIHNNGVYYHSLGNTSISYKGGQYLFELGKPIDFVSWPFVFNLVPDLLQLMVDVARSVVVSSHGIIQDPVQLIP
jgi:hypothetical protein